MRILHAPQNVAGMAGLMSRKQRDFGYNSYSYCINKGYADWDSDFTIEFNNRYEKSYKIILKSLELSIKYDVFQFYFGESLLGNLLYDVPILKKINKKLFFYFCGCDIRNAKLVFKRYETSACKECWPMGCSRNREKAYKLASKYGNKIFVSTPDLLEFVPEAVIIPQAIDREKLLLKAIEIEKRRDTDLIKIIHAPSSRSIKGTKYVIDAIDKLREKYKIDFQLIENLTYEKALENYVNADIAIDQLLVGAYGQFSVELMALGKPVICYIREDVKNLYPNNLPIINANTKNLVDILEELIIRRDQWEIIGERSKIYVDEYHNENRIAETMLEYYKS